MRVPAIRGQPGHNLRFHATAISERRESDSHGRVGETVATIDQRELLGHPEPVVQLLLAPGSSDDRRAQRATRAHKHGTPAPPDEYASPAPVNRRRGGSRCSINAAVWVPNSSRAVG
jgi:hypothetical protein